ncbi:MAG: tetratricopeptide repeat protein [Lentisphaeria bacterium]|nr:tetratricopeptide repeat protein [Lentisphaeria bacterium]
MKKYLSLIFIFLSAVLYAQDFSKIVETFKNGKQEEALAKISSILKVEPKNQSALLLRCQFYAKLDQLDKMILDLNTLSELNPENVSVYHQLAVVYKYQGKFNKAILNYRKASKIEPKKIETLLEILSIFVQDKKDITAGIAESSRIIHTFPEYKPVYFSRGYLWAANGDMLNAYQDLATVVEIDPKSIEAYNAQAWWMATYPNEKYRNGARAVKNALIACENSAWKDPRVLDTLAAAYAEVGDFKESLKLISQALKLVKTGSADQKELLRHKVLFEQQKPVREYPEI